MMSRKTGSETRANAPPEGTCELSAAMPGSAARAGQGNPAQVQVIPTITIMGRWRRTVFMALDYRWGWVLSIWTESAGWGTLAWNQPCERAAGIEPA